MSATNQFDVIADDQVTSEWQVAISTKTKKKIKKTVKKDAKKAEKATKVEEKTTSDSEKDTEPMTEQRVLVSYNVRHTKEANDRVTRELAENKHVFGEIINANRDFSGAALAAIEKITKTSKWIRLLNAAMNHNGFQYVEGLNKDHLQFNPIAECGPGGLYFCEEKDIRHWLSDHTLMADVEIPEDAQVSHMQAKSKADKIILKNIRPLQIPEEFTSLYDCIRMIRSGEDAKINTPTMARARVLYHTQVSENYTEYEAMMDNGVRTTFPKYTSYEELKKFFANQSYISLPDGIVESTRKLPPNERKSMLWDLVDIDARVVLMYFDNIPEDVMWKIITKGYADMMQFSLSRHDITKEMRKYAVEDNPLLVFRIVPEDTTEEMQLGALQKMGLYSWKHYCPTHGYAIHPAVREELEILAEKNTVYAELLVDVAFDLMNTIRQLPVIGDFVDAQDHKFHGSFVRWFTRESLVSGKKPSMDRVYEFLGHSDLDISTKVPNIITLLHTTDGVIVEHVELSEYKMRRRVRKRMYTEPIPVGNIRDGNYNCWIPCPQIASGWLRVDVIIEEFENTSDDYTVNRISMKNGKIKCSDPTSLVKGLIVPDIVGTDNLKKLYRVKKLLAAGYKLSESSKSMFRSMIQPYKKSCSPRAAISHVAVGDRRKPSITVKDPLLIAASGHRYVPLLVKVVFDDPDIKAIESWCME